MADRDAPYHHGNLRRALLDAALDAIAADGVDALSLRKLAAQAGVSHAAPAHHFVDRTGLLTAIAAEGYDLLADAVEAVLPEADFLAAGVAYVRFATTHPAHFEVMFRPALHHGDDPTLVVAVARASTALAASAAHAPSTGDPRLVGLAGWSLVHGLSSLWLAGNLPDDPDPVELARQLCQLTFAGEARRRPTRSHAGRR